MNHDEIILRKLAWEYIQAAQDERNTKNRILHRAVNDLKQIRPVVLINEIPFHELNFDGSLTLQCQDPELRSAEDYLRKQLFHWKYFPADMILSPYFPVYKVIRSDDIGITISEETLASDSANSIVSHEYHDQLATEEAVEKLHLPTLSYDREETMRQYDRIANVIGDILPVRIVGHNCYISIWDQISTYRGVTPLLMDLVERPEFSHKIVSKLTEIEISRSEQMEKLERSIQAFEE